MLVLTCIAVVACDPATSYRPIGWEAAPGPVWKTQRGPLFLETRSFGGLDLAKQFSVEFTVENTGDLPAKFLPAVIETRKAQKQSIGPTARDAEWYTVPPHSRRPLTFTFDLEAPIVDSIATTTTLRLRVEIGADTVEIPIQGVRN